MKHPIHPHVQRRGRATSTLRVLTTGAAVAGLAGTAGFGLVAASTFAGKTTGTEPITGISAIGSDAADPDFSESAVSAGPVEPASQPPGGGFGPASPTMTGVPRPTARPTARPTPRPTPRLTAAPAHVASGGSG